LFFRLLAALGLEVAELGESAFELAREALFVERDVAQGLGLVAELYCGGQVHAEVVLLAADVGLGTEGEDVGFDCGDAHYSPGGVGE